MLHIFQFESKQGEDICMALQTHINDIMMKRYTKVKASQVRLLPPGAISPVQLEMRTSLSPVCKR